MAGPFIVYDTANPRGRKLTDGPAQIRESRFDSAAWNGVSVNGKVPKGARDVLHCKFEDACLNCDAAITDLPKDYNKCKRACIVAFRKEHFNHKIQIRASEKYGLGAFNGPTEIPEGAYIGEYLGDLAPYNPTPQSAYAFNIRKQCTLDAQNAGNWTRFINSHCHPNLDCDPAMIGKKHTLVFKTRRAIAPGEELTFYYERGYFDGFVPRLLCKCDWKKRPHVPRGRDWKAQPTRKVKQSDSSTDVSTTDGSSPPSGASKRGKSKSKSKSASPSTKDKVKKGRVSKTRK